LDGASGVITSTPPTITIETASTDEEGSSYPPITLSTKTPEISVASTVGMGSSSPETYEKATFVTSENTAPEINQLLPGASTNGNSGLSLPEVYNKETSATEKNEELESTTYKNSTQDPETSTDGTGSSWTETYDKSTIVILEKTAPENNRQFPGDSTIKAIGHSSPGNDKTTTKTLVKDNPENNQQNVRVFKTPGRTTITLKTNSTDEYSLSETYNKSRNVSSEKSAPENNPQFPGASTIEASGHSLPGNDNTTTKTLVKDNSENNQQNVRVFKTPGRTTKTLEKRTTPSTRIYSWTEKKPDVQSIPVNKTIGNSPTEAYNRVSPEPPSETTTRNGSNSSNECGIYNLALLICAILTLVYK